MPELPEVETLARHLRVAIVGHEITGVHLGLPKMFHARAGQAIEELMGKSIAGIRRRGKFLILDLSDDTSLVIHLRLSGQIVVFENSARIVAGGHPVPAFDAPLPHKATHFTLTLSGGIILYLTDIRQFGFLQIVPTESVAEAIGSESLGPDAMGEDLRAEVFVERLHKRGNARLKPLLLDQQFLAGLGNIYVDEALYAAGLHPLRTAGSLTVAEAETLYRSIREVLDYALTKGVAKVLNGRTHPDVAFPRVHGREGQPCRNCGTTIVKTRVGGRGTYTCPVCQRLG